MKQAFQLLKIGRIDLTMSVELTAEMFLRELYPEDDSIRKTEKNLMVTEDGTLLSIMEKYYGKGRVPDNAIVK